jgi:cytoskeletal protein CcmA (bactofilin family)
VVVFGEVNGNIKATQLVELKSSARVKGNIETPSLVIEKGVVFEGACKMENLGKGATITPLNTPMKQADEKK